jgi:hypothetical protein
MAGRGTEKGVTEISEALVTIISKGIITERKEKING